MSDVTNLLADTARALVEWNDKGEAWLRKNVENDREEPDDDFEFVMFKTAELDLFLKNMQDAKKYLRLMAAFFDGSESRP